MPEHVGFQVAPAPQQGQQQVQQQTQPQIQQRSIPATTTSSTLGEFIADDLKLFVAPVTVVVDEFFKQLKR